MNEIHLASNTKWAFMYKYIITIQNRGRDRAQVFFGWEEKTHSLQKHNTRSLFYSVKLNEEGSTMNTIESE